MIEKKLFRGYLCFRCRPHERLGHVFEIAAESSCSWLAGPYADKILNLELGYILRASE